MSTIDILVSAASDVQKESAVAEHLIRSLAAEFELPVCISYSNRLRGAKEDAAVERKVPEDESTPVVRPFFWECPAFETDDLPVQDQTQYDLVICLLWSRFTPVLVEKSVLSNGGPPSATNYEIDSILGPPHQTSEVQRLRVYRNRASPDSLLEPKEAREEMSRQWGTVQDFFARWEKNNEIQFRECCQEFLDLEEFANLFRQHFRNFLVQQLDRRIDPMKAPPKNRFRGLSPFRGLNFFDFGHAPFYYGRTRAIGEVLDALKSQAMAKKSFVLVLGPSGSGKSSLLRAGVLPLLTQEGTPLGNEPWSRVITRPSVGDPVDTLAAALAAKFALAELPDPARPDESLSLASRLKKDPENAASQIAEVLGKTKMRLALVVDQLEELFIGISPSLQGEYITALCALARCEGICVITALRSEFYPQYQRFPELVELTSSGGKYELQPPTAREIANMIRLPAEAVGVCFERDPKTGQSLDDALLEAATSSSDALPLLEHILSLLYNRQLRRKDGLLRWSDYCQLGKFENALAQHAEFVFARLDRDEQSALKIVIRHLLAPSTGKEKVLIRRPVAYDDLVSSPKLNHRLSAAARPLINRLINEGLLSSNTDSKQCRLISLPHDALLHRWPTLQRSLSEDQHFFGMRDRLDESLRLWLSRGEQSDHLLHDRVALVDANTLLKDFGSALSQEQVDYIQQSLARQKRRGRVRDYFGLAAIVVFIVFALIVGANRFDSAKRRIQIKPDVQSVQPDKSLADKDPTALETQLKEAEARAEDELKQLRDAELTDSQGKALQTQLKDAEDKVKQAPTNSDETSSQLSALQVQLKQEQDKAQKARADADALISQRDAWQSQLKQAEEKLAQVRANSGDTASQLSALQAQLKQEQEKEQKAQADADSLTSERNALQNQLRQAEAKALLPQQNADLVSSQRSALEAQLKEAEEKLKQVQANSDDATNQLKQAEAKAQLAQQNVELVSSQRGALDNQLKEAEERLKQVQANFGDATNQLSALQAQLKQEQEKEQKAQANADSLTGERNALQSQLNQAGAKALQNQLKEAGEKLKQVQTSSGDTSRQVSALQAQLKQEQEKGQASANSLTSERNALQSQLKQAEAKALLAQQNADLAGSQRSALEAQLRDAEEKLKQANGISGDIAGQPRALQARLYLPQTASPVPSPSTNGSGTANPAESQSTGNSGASGNVESLKEFVLGYLRTVASDDAAVQRRFFADRVSFYGRGVLGSSSVEASTEQYHREWPVREWTPRGEARITRLSHRDRFIVHQPFRWAVSDGSRQAKGNATLYLLIQRDSQGEFRIVNVHQLDR